MTPRDFCYWLQGYFELLIENNEITLSERQVKVVKDHLNLVFIHSIDTPDQTGVLQATHDGKKILTEDDAKELRNKIKDLEAQLIEAKLKSRPPLARC